MTPLDPDLDVVSLVAALCDIPSVSGSERELADAVEAALRAAPGLDILRDGNTLVARTQLGRPQRVALAGHLDTVPLGSGQTLPTRLEDGQLWGRGTVDMKGGVAVQLRLATHLRAPSRDITFVFYDCEEVDSSRNGLRRLASRRPDLLAADFAVLLEPTDGAVEGGCKGTLRADVAVPGLAAHSARPWAGVNAIHRAADVLQTLIDYQPRIVEVDGLAYHEALQAVGVRGGLAGNVIPDQCVVSVNYRFAPDRDGEEAVAHVQEVFAGHDVTVTDLADGARPGLGRPAAREFVAALGLPVRAKEGWTDVAQFAELGIPAVNFGPGDPLLAHADDERCPVSQYVAVEQAMLRWLA